MTEIALDRHVVPPGASSEHETLSAHPRRPRGPFEIFRAPPIERPPSPEEAASQDVASLAYFLDVDYSGLLATHDEAETREALEQMVRAMRPGTAVSLLFAQPHRNGMILGHGWFGPHLPLYRHSHPRHGDCLYYVLAGQAIMGSHVLNPGDGLFIPNGIAYKFRAGPEGVEILELRAGGGIKGAPAIKIHEVSLDPIRRITATAREHHHEWGNPPGRIADSPLCIGRPTTRQGNGEPATTGSPAAQDMTTPPADSLPSGRRTKLELYHAQLKNPTPTHGLQTGTGSLADPSGTAMDLSSLLEHHHEPEVREHVERMRRAMTPGVRTTLLYGSSTGEDVGLAHAWYGPHFQMFRHSRPDTGDCLFYVVAGEVTMQGETLVAGDGFFVPEGAAFAFAIGPRGGELLEYRSGGGISGEPHIKVEETSLEEIDRVIEVAERHQREWTANSAA